MNTSIRKWLAIPLMLCLVFVLAACDADGDDDEVGGGGGLAGTATIEGDGLPPVNENGNANEAPPPVELTPDRTTPVVPTPEVAATETMTSTDTITGTDVMTDSDMTSEGMRAQAILQASELIDMTVVNENNEEFGEVAEVLIDEQGQIRYVFVNDLEMDDDTDATTIDDDVDYVVLTWDDLSFELDRDSDDPEDGRLVIKSEAMTTLDTLTAVDADIFDSDSIVIEVADIDLDLDVPAEYVGLLKVRQYNDYNLVNADNDDLGEISELLIDTSRGSVVYLIADVGGFLGLGETQVAIPWDHVVFRTEVDDDGDIDDTFFVFNVDQETLENAPTIDLDDWNPFVEDNDWDVVYSQYWDAILLDS